MNELRAGDWVQVKKVEEILGTLDENACLDALPFMPEMLQYCGNRFRVFRTAHKTCTPPSVLMRTMVNTVHLEGLRCDGEAHGGCQAGCLLFWKTDWLTPVAGPEPDAVEAPTSASAPVPRAAPSAGALLDSLTRNTEAPVPPGSEKQYRCQSTELVRATRPARWWDPRLYLRDLTSRNVRLRDLLRYGLIATLNMALRAANRREYPFLRPRAGAKTPTASLGLQPGEWVQVRSNDEIMGTLDEMQKNRGLRFDVEMLPFCGKRVQVLRRAERFIDERNGRMTVPRNSCLILEDVACSGCLSTGRLFCPRSIYSYWHEIWLKRADQAPEEALPGR